MAEYDLLYDNTNLIYITKLIISCFSLEQMIKSYNKCCHTGEETLILTKGHEHYVYPLHLSASAASDCGRNVQKVTGMTALAYRLNHERHV